MCQSSKIALLILVCIISLAVFVSKLSDIIMIHHQDLSPVSDTQQTDIPNTVLLGSSAEHMMWFVQISDIHISIFHDPARISNLRKFCNTTISVINPAVVLASGDLTDGKALDGMGSDQYIQEWEHYKAVLEETNVTKKTVWLDIRGNHDNFNVPGISSQRSFFHRFSVQGTKHKRSYMYTLKSGSETYSFIAVDACLDPGPRRPFNFIGSLTDDQFELLERFEIESRKTNGTIWFGHYPTSCIVSPSPGVRHLMRNGVAYMCGHLHTLGNLVKNMYTVQHSGILELELGDWKDNRIYRVAAFDHGLFSFTDVYHESWPVILITNPKDALFVLHGKDPQDLMKHSTHIRILVFSPSPIEKVRVYLDESIEWLECENVEGPLYVVKWNPDLYSSGLHNIRVYARDTMGQFSEISQTFSLDGTRMSFRLLPRIALMTDAKEVFRGVFVALVSLSVLPLLILRILQMLVRARRLEKPDVQAIWCRKLLRRLWILSTINKLFIPIILYPIYLLIGPWFIGEVIEGHIGATFAWGTVVSWTVLPTAFTYFYGIVQLFWFHIPLILILSYNVDTRFKEVCFGNRIASSNISRHVPCACVLILQALFAYYFWLAYGTIAFILGPLRTWSVVMGIYLWYSSATLSRHHFAEACLTWRKNDYPDCNNGNLLQSSHRL